MTLYRLHLTPEERQTLEGWQKKYKSHSAKRQHVQILLNSDESTGRRPAPELAAVLGCSTKTVERVRRQFCEEGLAMFEPKPRKTRSDKKIDGRVEAHLTALLCQSPPDEHPRWQLKLLAERLVELAVVDHISTTMVARLLKKTNSSLFTGQRSG
ncbi:MAG: helix-turn-helix domain-containing protein [Hymenobacter sp.]|nr:MAG: helix-turn-helix domain-containing protein [Hymenobacter sp.]